MDDKLFEELVANLGEVLSDKDKWRWRNGEKYDDEEITRLRAALEAFPLLPNVPMAEIDKATLLHKVYRWANGPRKQALGEGDE